MPGRRLEPAASARPPAAEVEPALLVAPAGGPGRGARMLELNAGIELYRLLVLVDRLV